MASPVVRAWPVYYRGRKVAEAFDNGYGIQPARTAMFGAEGYLCHSKGAVMSSLTIQYVQPVAGTSVDFIADLINQNDVEIAVPIGGKIYMATMACTEGSVKANTQTGVAEGSITLSGGVPAVA